MAAENQDYGEKQNEVQETLPYPTEIFLKEHFEKILKVLQNIPCVPVLFSTGRNFSTGRKFNWSSPPFITHPHGYKMVLSLHFYPSRDNYSHLKFSSTSHGTSRDTGSDDTEEKGLHFSRLKFSSTSHRSSRDAGTGDTEKKGLHYSDLEFSSTSHGSPRGAGSDDTKKKGLFVNFVLLEGERDDYLRFPVRMSIEVHVLKKSSNGSHSITFKFDDSTPPHCTARCYASQNEPDKSCEMLLLEQQEISEYAVDNCLTFKIVKVETNSTLP